MVLFLGPLIFAGWFYLDANVHAWVVEHQTRNLRTFMRGISRWGDWPRATLSSGLCRRHRGYALRKRDWLRIIIAMIVACALAGAATRIIKIAAGRSRPSVTVQGGLERTEPQLEVSLVPIGAHRLVRLRSLPFLGFARRRILSQLLPIPLLIGNFAHPARCALPFRCRLRGQCSAFFALFLVWRFVHT